jgi:hypothetical protein
MINFRKSKMSETYFVYGKIRNAYKILDNNVK